MRKSDFFMIQVNRTAYEIMRESGDPVGAIFVAMFTAAFNCGHVHPMHITLTGCDGQYTKATRFNTDLTFECVAQMLKCPLHAVVTDDAAHGSVEADIDVGGGRIKIENVTHELLI